MASQYINWESRPLRSTDQAFLWDMLYIALWDAPCEPRRPRSVLGIPHIKRLAEDWGRPDDFGLVAIHPHSQIAVGAIWSRLDCYDQLPDFGCAHPCLGIAVADENQNQGVGSFLMKSFITALRDRTDGLRLGVNPKNHRALKLYLNCGFQTYALPVNQYPQMKLEFR